MAVQEHRPRGFPVSGFMRRLGRARLELLFAAFIFAALAQVAGLGVLPALIGFASMALAVLIGEASLSVDGEVAPFGNPSTPAIADRTVEAVVSGLPDPAIVLTPDALVVAFNASVQQITPGILRGEPISFALRVPNVLEAVRAVAASRQMRRTEFFQRVPTDRWWEATIAPLVLPGEAPNLDRHLILLALRDFTPLRRVEEMRADFVANASHELRTPLASLSGFIETLQGSARNDAQARERFLDIMKAQATRMARLIDDLLSLSRIELKAHVQPETQVDLAPIVRQVADALQTLARDRGVEVKIDMPPETLLVRADRDELIRVFENLVENALKYGASGKRIDITLAREAGESEAVAAVRDYGPGIAPEHLPRLTERIYRVDVTESRAQGGTGLGLALVKHILHRHRGRLTIASAPGRGATFTVRLPLDQRK